MGVVHSKDMDRNIKRGYYDPRSKAYPWDNRAVTFLEHHHGLTRHFCTPLEALYKTHPWLKDQKHSVEVEQHCLRVFSPTRPYWFSVVYIITDAEACVHCGGRKYEPTCWARPCHKCSPNCEIVTASCGSNRFDVVVVKSEIEK